MNRYAVANGNWSSTSTWDGGSLPASTDDVFAGGFTVTIDQDITVNTLNNGASTSPVILGGGGFVVSTTRNITITSSMYHVYPTGGATNSLLRLAAPSGSTVTVNFLDDATAGTDGAAAIRIDASARGVVNITGCMNSKSGNAALVIDASNITVNLTEPSSHYGALYDNNAAVINGDNLSFNVHGDIQTKFRSSLPAIGGIVTNGNAVTIGITGNMSMQDKAPGVQQAGGTGLAVNAAASTVFSTTGVTAAAALTNGTFSIDGDVVTSVTASTGGSGPTRPSAGMQWPLSR